MVVRRRKKSRKLRGRTRTMSWGRIGQHRKSGSKGGYGAAGLGKHEWTWTIKYAPTWYGKKGFNPPRIRAGLEVTTINVGQLDEIAALLEAQGKAEKEDGKIVVNLEKLGIHKLLGEGRVARPLKVITPLASELAIKKIEEAGGEVIVTRATREEAEES
ncbi:50S ribosomal protein L15P [Aeropyrum pernix K1]|uniref:Large ribosomal subunit protein uL15 n=2 Tax=Aeropyrum pernix TaxID=56636 RepID=RL15_AERPE|nr:uL15 family ribosomal protein [Aeropyrum pernix]Q9YF98.1 RecName: Full=Large ribosomal subunit protein uL15; AltName: Full=50S ribosomal protein L15 [Aeropyrum pernix K1]BAA79298.1 50S ribosomal protein L15P [Aeropyrum pernix K1]GBF09677.1 50S ribosomal protein L15 [Aeropyrum pernix]